MNDDPEHSSLAKAVRDAGPSCCGTTASANDVLRQAGFDNIKRPNVEEIARALGLMVLRYTRSNGKYAQDFAPFASVLNQKEVDWIKVIRALDYPDFKIRDKSGLEYIVKAFRSADKVCNSPSLPLSRSIMTDPTSRNTCSLTILFF